MLKIKSLVLFSALSLMMLGTLGAVEEANSGSVDAQAMPCIYPPVHKPQRLQKVYTTSDRIVITDNAIFYVDYNGVVQTTPGVFVDQGGLYVFSLEPIYTILPCPMPLEHK
jgi:hypothetical protein